MNSLQPSAFNLAPPPTLQWQPVQIANFMAVAGNAYPCNTTSAAFTVTLPASPSAGDQITLTDYAGTWDTNNLTVDPYGLKIQGLTSNIVLKTSRGSVQLVYVDATQGWVAYAGFAVTSLAVPLEYLVVAGGGSGGNSVYGGGGGAGGFRTGSTSAFIGQVFTATVGAGGASKTSAGTGNDGVDSSLSATGGFSTFTASGGGGGGGNGIAPNQGGSGGGGGGSVTGALGNKGAYTPAEGNAGGNGAASAGAGGGGAGAAGGNATGNIGGNGGIGSEWPTGSGTYRAGGGAGYATSYPGTGGQGGGGNINTAGGVNTGGGGGAWGGAPASGSGAGGKGVVILRYPDTFAAATSTTGSPTQTTTDGYRYYTFTGNGTLTL